MRLIAVFACLFLLGACGLLPPVAGAEAVSVLGNDKTFSDHVVSITSGKNCSILRTQADLTYCEEDEPNLQPPIFCYRTLGNVTCYDRPDPHKGRHRIVNEESPNLVRPAR